MYRMASFIAAILMFVISQAALADNIYVTIDGAPGSSVVKGHEKTIPATGFSLDVVAPTGTMGAEGKAKTSFDLSLVVDTSTGKLFEMAASHEIIKSIEVDIFLPSVDGKERKLLTIKLQNVVISKFEMHTDATKVGPQATTPIVDLTLDAERIDLSQD